MNKNNNKTLKLDKQTHWKPFCLNNEIFDLSHLDGHIAKYVQPAYKNKKEIIYTFYITYSFHCFTKDLHEYSNEEKEKLKYITKKENRCFCIERYNLSKNLPEIITNLDKSKLVFHAGFNDFATCKIKDKDGCIIEYFIVFAAYRFKKKLRLHIKSAYPLETKTLGKVKKVKFFYIANNLLRNKPLPKPQK